MDTILLTGKTGFFSKEALQYIGETAQVYLTILPNGENGGKVTLNSTSRFAEVDAITEGPQTIPSGSRVRIVDVRGDVVVVEKDL